MTEFSFLGELLYAFTLVNKMIKFQVIFPTDLLSHTVHQEMLF